MCIAHVAVALDVPGGLGHVSDGLHCLDVLSEVVEYVRERLACQRLQEEEDDEDEDEEEEDGDGDGDEES